MAETLRQYLADVELKLINKVDDVTLQAVLAETESHLRESVEEIQAMGFSRMDAESRALGVFGEVESYGLAIQHANPPKQGAPTWVVLSAASVSTAVLLTWPLFIRDYHYYHADETFEAMAIAVLPVLSVAIAALFGSRVRARSLFLVALVGGVILVPILAGRFIGSGFNGGFVVRSLQLRDSGLDAPGRFYSYAHNYQLGLAELDRGQQLVNSGHVPSKMTADGLAYLGPQAEDPHRLEEKPLPMGTFNTAKGALAAWHANGAATRAHDLLGLDYLNGAHKAQSRLDEPFGYRLLSMSSWGLVMCWVWGSLMVFIQTLGSALRWLILGLMRLSTRPAGPRAGLG